MSAHLRIPVAPPDHVTNLLAALRREVGWNDTLEAWRALTVEDIAAASGRRAGCARHGTVRVTSCEICRIIGDR